MPTATFNVNLLGGPGVGKSVLMSDLYSALKKRGINCEKVPEYAKELLYEGRLASTPQLQIITEQYMRQRRVQGCTEVAVTDAAVALSLVYADAEFRDELAHIVRCVTRPWSGINVLLHRDLDKGYESQGRYQSKDEAKIFHETQVVPYFRAFFGPDLLELPVETALEDLVDIVTRQVRPTAAAFVCEEAPKLPA